MLAYYINLDRRPDRRALMEQRFTAAGIAAVRLAARTPADISAELRGRYGDPRKLFWMTETEMACSLSHVLAWRQVVASGAPWAAIFEDDVLLTPALPEALAEIERAPAAPGLIRLEASGETLRVLPAPTLLGRFALLRTTGGPTPGAAGYAISRAAAEALLAAGPAIFSRAMDHQLFHPADGLGAKVGFAHLAPAVCRQDMQAAGRPDSDLAAERRRRAERERAAGASPLLEVCRMLHRELWVGLRTTLNGFVRQSSRQVISLDAAPPGPETRSDQGTSTARRGV